MKGPPGVFGLPAIVTIAAFEFWKLAWLLVAQNANIAIGSPQEAPVRCPLPLNELIWQLLRALCSAVGLVQYYFLNM